MPSFLLRGWRVPSGDRVGRHYDGAARRKVTDRACYVRGGSLVVEAMTVTTSAGEPVSDEELACTFAEHRPYLHAMAYRMLGSHADADDVVQEAWIRFPRVGGGIAELRGWLTAAGQPSREPVLRSRAGGGCGGRRCW